MVATPVRCPRCLRDLDPTARFCPICGARLYGSPRELRRKVTTRQLGGVCAGLADYLDIDPTLMRVLFAVGTLFTGLVPGFVLYLVLVIVIPSE